MSDSNGRHAAVQEPPSHSSFFDRDEIARPPQGSPELQEWLKAKAESNGEPSKVLHANGHARKAAKPVLEPPKAAVPADAEIEVEEPAAGLKGLSRDPAAYDFDLLLRKIRKGERQGKTTLRFCTRVYLDLMTAYRIDFDTAMVLSQAIYWESRAYYSPTRGRDVDPADEEPAGWLVDRAQPTATLGIPTKRFSRIVAKLDAMKLITRRNPRRVRMSPTGAANSEWIVREGKWVINVRMTAKVKKAVQGPAMVMPWACRAMMSPRYKKREDNFGEDADGCQRRLGPQRDIEDGNGAMLLWFLMGRMTRTKDGKWRCNRVRQGKRWSGATRQEWADLLRLRNVQQFDDLARGLRPLIEIAQGRTKYAKGKQPSRETLLRPVGTLIQMRWRRFRGLSRQKASSPHSPVPN